MSLRARLNLLITLLFILVLIGGSSYILTNARRAVSDEMESTAHLTLQLIEVVMASAKESGQMEMQQKLLDRLAMLETTRHLQIAVFRSGSPDVKIPFQMYPPVNSEAPAWFVRQVKPAPIEYRRIFAGPGTPYTEILIRADPSDEITEVWYEARSVFILLLLFIVSANLLVYFTLGRDLAPLESILMGLERIEHGDYRLRLPHFNLPELSRISDKFNHMAEVLLKSRDENRYLTKQSLEIQENERRHLAQELHDELGQSLSAMKAVAVSISKNAQVQTPPVGSDTIKESINVITELSDRMYDVARSMMQRLRPTILDELGLKTALQEMIDNWNGTYGDLFCHLKIDGEISNLGDRININLYRIIQESLTNIAKHAKASEVHVNLTREAGDDHAGRLMVIIRDDGIGFDSGTVQRGLGLLGMRERVEALNGDFKLNTAPNRGVEINIAIPLVNEIIAGNE